METKMTFEEMINKEIYMCCILFKYFEKQKEQLESERI